MSSTVDRALIQSFGEATERGTLQGIKGFTQPAHRSRVEWLLLMLLFMLQGSSEELQGSRVPTGPSGFQGKFYDSTMPRFHA